MIRVRQIKIPVLHDSKESLVEAICQKLKVSSISSYEILKKSIDARDKKSIFYVYEVDVEVLNENDILKKNKSSDIFLSTREEYVIPECGNTPLKTRPIVIGSGPAGLFCAYFLAEAGFSPIILERGEKMEDRIETISKFFSGETLNPNSNIQFGEGGAGTFSDGKLNTLTHDNLRGRKVFEIFVECGAPQEILYDSKPHIGTDLLRNVIVSLREKIISFGGEFHYSSCVTKILKKDNIITGVEINHKDIMESDVVVLAIGHSARDTFYMLHDQDVNMKNKNFAVGVRVEHPREMIDKSQYGEYYKELPPASYKLTYQTNEGRGVYSFCMCPGGYVVNASSEEGRICVNGMSNYKRDSKNSNSAIVVTVGEKDVGEDLFAGLEFQRKLEEAAYQEGKGSIPVQLYKDFVFNKNSTSFGEFTPNVLGTYSFGNICNVLPTFITSSIKEAMPAFGRKIKGFDREDAIFLGVEARTSSPIVIVRGEDFESNIHGLYPCGEGAGYAGGITTASIDGVKVAEEIIKKFSNSSVL